ncbi:hypothetical protein E0F15_08865 [Frankia sp. B2]|nr:hypothetical protein CcI6DRAFT_00442 [Frankia sp. CcI6]KDA44556.1 hypothetical protein BMG523Draft_00405 [Frankia sp. BMG5.23]KFB05559.1 hypothetical protein ALLO2DRAFT_01510 [Frankia sp. Allo2]OAA27668.1 hypothetical protein AAY23_102281 [Frankia casuarinae]OHV47748.1 hypothetical protein CgIS1_06480 [Frankia sp. CgIS1]TFE32148.1 hypothetical protein E0F15_08865 [Frankia sp. B2]
MRVIPVDVTAFSVVTAMGPAAPVIDRESGSQRGNADGLPLWTVPVAVAMADGTAEVITVRIAGEAPTVQPGTPVRLTGLVGRSWQMQGRHGISYSAASITGVSSKS